MRFRQWTGRSPAVFVVFTPVTVVGCGPAGPKTYPVRGKVEPQQGTSHTSQAPRSKRRWRTIP